MCVCVRERERGRETETETEDGGGLLIEKERKGLCVCVCVWWKLRIVHRPIRALLHFRLLDFGWFIEDPKNHNSNKYRFSVHFTPVRPQTPSISHLSVRPTPFHTCLLLFTMFLQVSPTEITCLTSCISNLSVILA